MIPDNNNVKHLCMDLEKLCDGPEDIIVADFISNREFCGTDDNGFPKKISKGKDGKYHAPGDIMVMTEKITERVLETVLPVLDTIKNGYLTLITPIPLYIVGRCCDSEFHLENFHKPNMSQKIVMSKLL
jgi:hypothetical protein